MSTGKSDFEYGKVGIQMVNLLKKRAALPQQPQVDPEVAADLKADPWAMIQDSLAREQQPEGGKPPVMPEKHTVEPEIPGGPYHMVGGKKRSSTNSNCEFIEWKPGQWYYILEDYGAPKDAWDWRENSTAYGPFGSEEEAHIHLRENQTNPGGSSTSRYNPGKKVDKTLETLITRAKKDKPASIWGSKNWTGRTGPGDGPRSLGRGCTGFVGGKKATETLIREGNMEKKSSRELLREKIAAMTEAKKARIFGRLRQVAENEPKKAGDSLGELAHSLGVMATSMSNFRENLDLSDVPKTASLRARMAAKKKYASEFRRIAMESPEQLADALVEFYNSLDEVASGVENLASNLGIDLGAGAGGVKDVGDGDEGLHGEMPMGGPEDQGGTMESPAEEKQELAEGFEGTPEDKKEDEELGFRCRRQLLRL